MKTEQWIAIEELAKTLGFHKSGVAKIPIQLRKDYYKKWIESGQHGTMDWMEKNTSRRLDPSNILPEAKCLLVFSLNYFQPDPKRKFRIAKYALGKDYHRFMLKRLKQICRFMEATYGTEQRPYVDTGPLLEKPIAEASGIGWQGKSTILVEPKGGTWSLLGTIVTTLDLPSSGPGKNYCGSCTRCIDACPTRAITAPYQLDASKCIAYLTIEHKGSIPVKFRKQIGDRVFGCDTCLDVCPWNKWAKRTKEANFEAKELPALSKILDWNQSDFDSNLQASPIRRLKLNGLKRNVALVLGNIGNKGDLAPLVRLAKEGDAVLSEQAEWSIQEINARD